MIDPHHTTQITSPIHHTLSNNTYNSVGDSLKTKPFSSLSGNFPFLSSFTIFTFGKPKKTAEKQNKKTVLKCITTSVISNQTKVKCWNHGSNVSWIFSIFFWIYCIYFEPFMLKFGELTTKFGTQPRGRRSRTKALELSLEVTKNPNSWCHFKPKGLDWNNTKTRHILTDPQTRPWWDLLRL